VIIKSFLNVLGRSLKSRKRKENNNKPSFLAYFIAHAPYSAKSVRVVIAKVKPKLKLVGISACVWLLQILLRPC